jgi:TonB family protein
MKTIFFITTLLILLVSGAQAQTTENWTRLESDAKDFSIAVPSNYEVIFDEDFEGFYGKLGDLKKLKIGEMRFITASGGGASFSVESYKTNSLSGGLSWFYQIPPSVNEFANFNFTGFEGKTYTRYNENSYSMEIIIGYKERIYRIFGGAKDKNNEALKYFLSSLKLNDKTSFVLKSSLDGRITETPVLISSVKETPFTVEKEKEDSQKSDKDDQAKSIKEEGKKGVVLLYKPQARYTEAARRARMTGTIRLRVTFSENGNIAKISVLSGLKNGLTENAVVAARLIRFLPMEIDNKPIATTKTVVYSFDIY